VAGERQKGKRSKVEIIPINSNNMSKKKMAPIIGITCSMEYDDEKRKYPTAYAFDYLKRNYYEAIERAGGIPIILPNTKRTENAESILERADGLLISGGNDVDPQYYGEKHEARNLEITLERDHFEIALVKAAMKKAIPILGICRGMQLLNVVFGGNLYQDFTFNNRFLDHTLEGSTVYKKKHPVIIREDSKLFEIIRMKKITVNTSHHQIIKTVGKGLVATAWSEKDKVIETIESDDKHYLLGIQWHPELMQDECSNALFDSLIQAAIDHRIKNKSK
jgi:putative glutamine amidotransferase